MAKVINVPPRRKRVYHKGMYGWVEYHPSDRSWGYTVKYQTTNVFSGETISEAAAVLQVKLMIDLLAGGALPVRSVD
jgi:hypothetical protein